MDTYVELDDPAAPGAMGRIHQRDEAEQPRDFIKELLACRADYHQERSWHKFLLDAYSGTGGFQGKVRQPFASFWGWAADVYRRNLPFTGGLMDDELDTYLDRFDREDVVKFERRAKSAHYPNYVANFIDVPLSFMFRKVFGQKPDQQDAGSLGKWMENADGAGTAWNDMVRDTIAPRAAVLGWAPVLFDMPSLGSALPTALDDERGQNLPYAVPLFPSNLLDWSHDDNGMLRWAKIRNDYVRRDDPLQAGTDITRITIWYSDRWEWYELAKGKDNLPRVIGSASGQHPFKRVPLLVMRRKPVPDDPFRGIPMAASASEEARRMFNYLSELDEHLRSCAFALFQVVTDQPDKIGSIIGGNGNAVPLKPDWKNEHKWLTPDPAISQMYESRISTTIEEMYRAQKMEFTRGVRGGQARSGVSQSFEFESANRAIADFARMVARFDEEGRRLASKALPAAPADANITTTAPQRFDVEEMAKELDEALSAITLRVGPTATAEIKKKVVRGQLPMADTETMSKIESEIDDEAELEAAGLRELSAADIQKAIQAARSNLDDPSDLLNEEGDTEEEEEAPAPKKAAPKPAPKK